ncbi:MAG: class I adenylate-forming enzyme family protein [bacterium]
MIINAYFFLEDSATKYPENIAIVYENNRITYNQLYNLVLKLAFILEKQGVKKGERVVILLNNSINYVISYFAILKIGAIVVALNTDTTSLELEGLLKDVEPKCVITNKTCLQYLSRINNLDFLIIEEKALKEILEQEYIFRDSKVIINENDIAQIIYTSGTTGKPKGIILTHLNLIDNTNSIIEYLKLTKEDSLMVILPFYYSYGNSLLLTHIKVGGKLVISTQFVFLNKVLELMIKEKVTGFSGVPSSYALLLHKSNIRNLQFPDLRYITCAGGALPKENILRLKEILPKVEIYIMYGQTEACARLSYLEPDKLISKLGSLGKGIPRVELKVKNKQGQEVQLGEVGEIIARGKNIMKGYWRQSQETKKVLKEDGLHTGDLATVDEEGYIYMVGRKSDMIKTGAFRVSPQEIEDILVKHKDVMECGVIGVPDPILSEVIKAFIVLTDDAQTTKKEILRFCKENLPYYKVPSYIEFIPSLPKTKSGKIKRYELKKIG